MDSAIKSEHFTHFGFPKAWIKVEQTAMPMAERDKSVVDDANASFERLTATTAKTMATAAGLGREAAADVTVVIDERMTAT